MEEDESKGSPEGLEGAFLLILARLMTTGHPALMLETALLWSRVSARSDFIAMRDLAEQWVQLAAEETSKSFSRPSPAPEAGENMCSFCCRKPPEVNLIGGGAYAFICENCVTDLAERLRESFPPPRLD